MQNLSKTKKENTKTKVADHSIEFNLQFDCFQWTWKNFPEYRKQLFHVPNGGQRNKIEAGRLKMSGTIKGIPDLIFVHFGNTYFFELKTDKGSISPEQKIIHSILKQNGFRVYLIRSFEQFVNIYTFLIMETLEDTQQRFEKMEQIYNLEIFKLPKDLILYQFKIWEYLYSLPLDEIVNIDDICQKENQQKFIDCLKRFLIFEFDIASGFSLEFNSEFTKFRKLETHSAYLQRKADRRKLLFGRFYENKD
jgi:hypothetical protein